MKVTEYIPRNRFNLWYDLFKKSNGRFLCNPIIGKNVLVTYFFEDMDSYKEMQLSYQRLTMPIRETKRGHWKSLKIRIMALIK